MPRGRRPDPDALKVAKGNPGKRAIKEAPATATTGAVKPSSKLNAKALAVWRDLAPDLERMNFLRSTDRHAFSRYCDTLAHYWDVTIKLRDAGDTYDTDSAHGSMKRINPLFIIQDRLVKRLTDLEDRFGLSPAARQSIMLRLSNVQPQLPLGIATTPASPTDTPAALDSPIGLLGAMPTRH